LSNKKNLMKTTVKRSTNTIVRDGVNVAKRFLFIVQLHSTRRFPGQ
jgi:hypothetical protein